MDLTEFKNDAPPFEKYCTVFYGKHGCEIKLGSGEKPRRWVLYRRFTYLRLEISIILN